MEQIAQLSASAVYTVWWASISIALIVAVVVAILLERVRRTAVQILAGAGQIWTHGQLVARDTVQIKLFLNTTNRVVGQILDTAKQIVGATEAIEQHAEGCPGCPECVLGRK
jgi:Na+/citrate or Na+/malate symporter